MTFTEYKGDCGFDCGSTELEKQQCGCWNEWLEQQHKIFKIMTTKEVTEEEIERAFTNTNFGPMPKRDLVKYGLLKVACGYYNGHTLKRILLELGLINANLKLTKMGQGYLYDAFSNGTSV